jgi:anti-sigma-K factor RskA
MSPHEQDELYLLAGEYVLGVLPADEARQVERRAEAEIWLRAAIGYWATRFLGLVSAVPPVTPSAALWHRIERTLAVHARQRVLARFGLGHLHDWWHEIAFWRALTATGFAATVLLAVFAFAIHRPAPPLFTVVLQAPTDNSVGWVVHADVRGDIQLTPLRQTNVPAGRSLQFWTKADEWTGPVSLGLVPADQSVRVSAQHLPPVQPNQLFEITLEPQYGSPVKRPTGPVLYIGRAVKLQRG